MGDLRAASHQTVPTLTTAPLNANATLLLELGFRWLRLRADQTIVSKNTIGAGDASRHAQSIGKSPPQVQSTLCPPLSRTSHFDAGRPLLDGRKAQCQPLHVM